MSVYSSCLRSRSTTACFGEHYGCLQWLKGLLGFSLMPPGPAARDQSRHQWWLELVMCHTQVWTPATSACVVLRASCKHTYSGRSQGRLQRLGSTVGTLAAAGPWISLCTTWAAGSYNVCMAVETSYEGLAGPCRYTAEEEGADECSGARQ